MRALILASTIALSAAVLTYSLLQGTGARDRPDQAPSATDHATIPLFDVLTVGESSVVVTNRGGWTREQVVTYLHELKKARAKGALASVGIPAPSQAKGYDAGVIYLVDGHPGSDHLAQFVRNENPGYQRVAPTVRGLYRWPPDQLVLGFSERDDLRVEE